MILKEIAKYDLSIYAFPKGCDVNFLKYLLLLIDEFWKEYTYSSKLISFPLSILHNHLQFFCVFNQAISSTQIEFLKFNQQWNNLPLSSTSSQHTIAF